ncbi:hypothetical protein [Sorangium sp. So ce693]|uniref:hypothetical protein n=1 Tax=Sorangium sp. So ce693 TaxID=3133318 RepID=UPI003F61AE25
MSTPEPLFAAQFPIRGDGFEIELVEHCVQADDLYAVVRVVLFDEQGGVLDILENKGPALSPTQMAASDLAERLAAWRADVEGRALECVKPWLPSQLMPHDYPPEARVAAEDGAYQEWRAAHDPLGEDEIRSRAEACLALAFERFPAVSAHFARVFGLRLPRHLAVARALFDLCGDLLARRWLYPDYLLELFQPEALARRVRPGFDERLAGRYDCDAPEMVTAMNGRTDGLHWGLWFDDPQFVPSLVVSNYASDGGPTFGERRSLLGEISHVLDVADHASNPEIEGDVERRYERRRLREYIAALADADARAFEADAAEGSPDTRGPDLRDSPGLVLPMGAGEVPAALTLRSWPASPLDAQDDEAVAKSIADARAELAAGRPAHALALGRVLLFFGRDVHRNDAAALQEAAYRALGRNALAEIAHIHVAYKDWGTEIFESV